MHVCCCSNAMVCIIKTVPITNSSGMDQTILCFSACQQYFPDIRLCSSTKGRARLRKSSNTNTGSMDSPYCNLLHDSSTFQPAGCYVLLQSAEQGCESLRVSPLPLVSLTESRHTPASGGAALPAGMLHHGSETSPGIGWQSDSHWASGRTCGNKHALWSLSWLPQQQVQEQTIKITVLCDVMPCSLADR